jgi:nucleoside-diphosphate-sugar epimerase
VFIPSTAAPPGNYTQRAIQDCSTDLQESVIKVLVIGGTRNLGLSIIERLRRNEHIVTTLNRGVTPCELPAEVERLYGDRRKQQELEKALGARSFDAVIDTTLYAGKEALTAIELLQGRTGHFIFISTGQVYLIRKGVTRPFREEDYEGEIMAAPPVEHQSDYQNWAYGFHKREAEDHLYRAWQEHGFPVTSLRAPMINGERDHYHRILGYLRRMQDGGPILIPDEKALPVRHVYCEDVACAVVELVESGRGKGRAFNLSQDETASLEEILGMIAEFGGAKLRLLRVPRAKLEELALLPDCSPFSGLWMSELDNRRSKEELGLRYTPLREHLQKIVLHYKNNPQLQAEGYGTRPAELELAAST